MAADQAPPDLLVTGSMATAYCPTCQQVVDSRDPRCPRDGTPIAGVAPDGLVGTTLGGRYSLGAFTDLRGRLAIYDATDSLNQGAVVVTATRSEGIEKNGLGDFFALGQRLKRLSHPALTSIHDFGCEPGGPLFVVEASGWHRLDQELALRGGRRFPSQIVQGLATQLLAVLEYLHARRLHHGALTAGSLRLVFEASGQLGLQLSLADMLFQAAFPRAPDIAGAHGGPEQGVAADLAAAAQIIAEMAAGGEGEGPLTLENPLPQVKTLPAEGVRDDAITLPPESASCRVVPAGLQAIVTKEQGGGAYHSIDEIRRDLDTVETESEQRFGRYELLHLLAQGGMGQIYLARADGIDGIDGFDRSCVIKTIRAKLATDEEFIARFLAEARVLISLSHGNIVTVHDVGRVDDTYYIAMEYVAGKDLFRVINRAQELGKRLPLPFCLYIARELANGLAYAHRVRVRGIGGLVHRDVSPHNVMISYDGAIKLIDFGLVRGVAGAPTTKHGVVLGKLCYMSPEQVSLAPLDRRTDIYSLGLVLYEMLTGAPFFDQPTMAEVLNAVVDPDVNPPSSRVADIPAAVDLICLKAIAVKPEERYITAEQMRDDLNAELARIAPRTNPEEVGAFIVELFAEERDSERAMIDGLGVAMPPLGSVTPEGGARPRAVSLAGQTPSPIQLVRSEAALVAASAPLNDRRKAAMPRERLARLQPTEPSPPAPEPVVGGGAKDRSLSRGLMWAIVLATVAAIAVPALLWLRYARQGSSAPRPMGGSAERAASHDAAWPDTARPDATSTTDVAVQQRVGSASRSCGVRFVGERPGTRFRRARRGRWLRLPLKNVLYFRAGRSHHFFFQRGGIRQPMLLSAKQCEAGKVLTIAAPRFGRR